MARKPATFGTSVCSVYGAVVGKQAGVLRPKQEVVSVETVDHRVDIFLEAA